ncbi:MAG: KH domain-containing protein [Chloroflexi bacterium]|nr:KH domain-containing protein [Chloroflexota bacterium]MDA1147750.1 KH domain-containing protein [Chloroflexota bacterium]
MKALIEYIARSLATKPDEVEVIEEHRGDRVIIHLNVADDDKGRIIGRDGRCANAIRSLLHVAAVRAGVRASLDID